MLYTRFTSIILYFSVLLIISCSSEKDLVQLSSFTHKDPKINFADFNGFIFTSANAVKFLNHDEINKTIKCFCVGEATEKKARSFGFQNTCLLYTSPSPRDS